MMCSWIAAVERANIHHELIGPGSEQKRLHSDEKRMNYPAIKHEEMLYLPWCTGEGWWCRPVCDCMYTFLGVHCDLWPSQGSATSQLLVFWPGGQGQKKHSPLQNRLSLKLQNTIAQSRMRVRLCPRVCNSVQFSCLRKDTWNQAALSQPSATIAPQCCAYVYRERHAAAISSKCVNRTLLSHCASQMIDNERLAH